MRASPAAAAALAAPRSSWRQRGVARTRCAAAPPSLPQSAWSPQPAQVERVSARELSPDELAARCAAGGPLLVADAWPDLDGPAWLGRLVTQLGTRRVVYQARAPARTQRQRCSPADAPPSSATIAQVQSSGETELFEGALRDYLGEMVEESTHDAARFLFDEGALNGSPALQLEPPPFAVGGAGDGFAAFPPPLRPAPCCLLAGGTGARSSLHADPYAWTGWNVLLEGEKLWTFLPPSAAAEEALQAVRKPPNAWGAKGADVAAGWESAVDLYRTRAQAGEAGPAFAPSRPLPAWLEASATRCVQREGDLLLIPPATWHQTYHVGPTLALAGQYLNAHNARGVFGHMLTWCGAPDGAAEALLARPELAAASLQERVAAALRAALAAKHGAAAADALLEALWHDPPPKRSKRRTLNKTS